MPPQKIQFGQENKVPETIPFGSESSFNSSSISTPSTTSMNQGDVANQRVNEFENNDAVSLDDFASTKAGQAKLGVPFPSDSSDFSDKGSRTDNFLTGLGIVGKVGGNGIADIGNTTADVASFAWQAFKDLPMAVQNAATQPGTFFQGNSDDMYSKILKDPIGFAEGMIGDAIVQPIQGLTTGVKDLTTGQGISKAGSDVAGGLEKGAVAFIDRPIQSLIQFKLAKGLVTDPVGTATKVGKGMVEQPWQIAKALVSPIESAKAVGTAIQNSWDIVKNIPSMFTKDGQAKIAQAMGNQVLNSVQSNLKIDDLNPKLKGLDTNSQEYLDTKNELNMHQQTLDTAQKSVNTLMSTIANSTRNIFDKGAYSSPHEFTGDATSLVDNVYKSKDFNGALSPGGKPVPVGDVSSLTSFLRESSAKLADSDNADRTIFNKMADDLDLRQNINKTGGIDSYVNKLVQDRLQTEGIDPTKQSGRYTLAKEQYTQEAKADMLNKISENPQFFGKPLSTDSLYNYMTDKYNEVKTGFGQKLMSNPNDTSSPTSNRRQ